MFLKIIFKIHLNLSLLCEIIFMFKRLQSQHFKKLQVTEYRFLHASSAEPLAQGHLKTHGEKDQSKRSLCCFSFSASLHIYRFCFSFSSKLRFPLSLSHSNFGCRFTLKCGLLASVRILI